MREVVITGLLEATAVEWVVPPGAGAEMVLGSTAAVEASIVEEVTEVGARVPVEGCGAGAFAAVVIDLVVAAGSSSVVEMSLVKTD